MNHTWTYRPGEITEKDTVAIRGMTIVSPAACQVFLTGEVLVSRIGEVALHRLLDLNNAVDEPIIVLPHSSTYATATVRMTRFDAGKIWPLLGLEMLTKLIENECGWLGVKPFAPAIFDFYEALFEAMDLFDTYKTLEDNMYLNALTLFRKPLYDDLHVSTFFSFCSSVTFSRATMTESMIQARDKVWDRSKVRLTNAELEFLVNIR